MFAAGKTKVRHKALKIISSKVLAPLRIKMLVDTYFSHITLTVFAQYVGIVVQCIKIGVKHKMHKLFRFLSIFLCWSAANILIFLHRITYSTAIFFLLLQ